ncbi:hypothetical protein M426DRAFT_176797 [Hypoxylon sp. CI-4A]|nr:hypothetical protein M426DRAFT_176797 [Hypoxylon sp. CI-4A]
MSSPYTHPSSSRPWHTPIQRVSRLGDPYCVGGCTAGKAGMEEVSSSFSSESVNEFNGTVQNPFVAQRESGVDHQKESQAQILWCKLCQKDSLDTTAMFRAVMSLHALLRVLRELPSAEAHVALGAALIGKDIGTSRPEPTISGNIVGSLLDPGDPVGVCCQCSRIRCSPSILSVAVTRK